MQNVIESAQFTFWTLDHIFVFLELVKSKSDKFSSIIHERSTFVYNRAEFIRFRLNQF
jgi:hypothetical protein